MQGFKNYELGKTSSESAWVRNELDTKNTIESRNVYSTRKRRGVDKFFENPEISGKKGDGYSEMVILGIVRSLKPRFCTRYLGVQDMSFKF